MTTVIKIEGDAPYLIPHVDHIAAVAHGENIDLTMYVALPGHTDLEPVYVQLSVPAADALLVQLSRAVAETAKHRSGTLERFPDKIDRILSWPGMRRIRIRGNLAKHGLELGKQLLDRIQVGALSRKVKRNCTPGFDHLFNATDHAKARIVHDYDIAPLQSWSEEST